MSPVVGGERPRGKEFYASGPWLVIFSHGLQSEAWAREIALQCHVRDVACHLTTAAEVELHTLSYYTGFVVVLPSSTAGAQAGSHKKLVSLVRVYRAHRPNGLAALARGLPWFEVGVVQVFDDASVDSRSVIRSIKDMVCEYHRLSQDDVPMPFTCYENLSRQGQGELGDRSTDRDASSVELLRAKLHEWNIDWSIEAVTPIRNFINSMRGFYENPRFSDLHRPVPGDPRNRLHFVLDEPAFSPQPAVCSHKKWMEGGQRVVTRVLSELQKEFPHVRRPEGRDGKKGKQQDFQDLYRALRTAEEILSIRSPSPS
jgi:hypothetical protein